MWRRFLIVLLCCSPALATDYYVRTDGDSTNCTGQANAAYPGSGSGQACAWANVDKCATTISAGDRCLIQAGTYLQTYTFGSANEGNEDQSGPYAYGCNFTSKSTTVTCTSTPTSISVGQWIRANNSYTYFSWTRVAGKDGTTITLEEGYRGNSTSNQSVRVANFIEYRGVGTVSLTSATKTNKPTFTQHETYPRVWYYTQAGQSLPWLRPRGFREAVSTWDIWEASDTGRASFLEADLNTCPCNKSTCVEAVDSMPGSFCSDGTTLYIQMRDGGNPNTNNTLEAGYRVGADPYTKQNIWETEGKNFTAFRNLTLISPHNYNGAINDGSSYFSVMSWGTRAAQSSPLKSLLIENISVENGACWIRLNEGMESVEFNGVRCLEKLFFHGGGSSATQSGLRFYNIEQRGGQSQLEEIVGASSSDRVIFDRWYVHRMQTLRYTSDCGQTPAGYDYYLCATRTWRNKGYEMLGAHGLEWGAVDDPDRTLNHCIFQNSVIEVTADGIQWMSGSNGSDIIIRNNTFGYSGAPQDNTRAESLRIGTTLGTGMGYTIRNNIFYVDPQIDDATDPFHAIRIEGNPAQNTVDSDYNLFLHPYNSPSSLVGYYEDRTSYFKVWNYGSDSYTDKTIFTARSESNMEQHSIFVCHSNCTTGTGVYNDGANSTSYFVRPTVVGAAVSNYTPTSLNRGVNAGDNGSCPSEDFYGNPRSDGYCDMGAIEKQATSSVVKGLELNGVKVQ